MADFLKNVGQPFVYKLIQPLITLMVKFGVTPNAITIVGFFINIAASIILILGADHPKGELKYLLWAGVTILFGGLFDMIDGRLARVSKQESKFGALFDSVMDRYSELVMFLGICYYLVTEHYFLSSLFAFIAMIGSMMVSYVRARAEGLGIECKGGWMQRPERIILISISAITCGLVEIYFGEFRFTYGQSDFPIFENISLFTFPIFILAIMTNITAIRRLKDSKRAIEFQEQKI